MGKRDDLIAKYAADMNATRQQYQQVTKLSLIQLRTTS